MSQNLSEDEEVKAASDKILKQKQVEEKLNQLSTHDSNLVQVKLDRKSTIKQAKTIRERITVS